MAKQDPSEILARLREKAARREITVGGSAELDGNRRLGEIIAEKLNASAAPVTVAIPLQGPSTIDSPGRPSWLQEADQALVAALKSNLRPGIPVIEMDCNINDPAFAECCAAELMRGIGAGGRL